MATRNNIDITRECKIINERFFTKIEKFERALNDSKSNMEVMEIINSIPTEDLSSPMMQNQLFLKLFEYTSTKRHIFEEIVKNL